MCHLRTLCLHVCGSGSVHNCGSVCVGFSTVLCLLAPSLFLIIQTWPALTVGTESNFFSKNVLQFAFNFHTVAFFIFIFK